MRLQHQAHVSKHNPETGELLYEKDTYMTVAEYVEAVLEVWPVCDLICKKDGTRIMQVWFSEVALNAGEGPEYRFIIKPL